MNEYNVRDFGAKGALGRDDTAAVQRAVDACAQDGGGVVYVPPGTYECGTVILRSHVRVYLESGARLCSARGASAFPKPALFYGENCEHISIEGRGIIDGRAEYDWRETDSRDHYIRDNELLIRSTGRQTMRPFPRAECIGHLVLLMRCRDVLIRGVSMVDCPSWTIHPYGCERLTIDGVYIHSSREEGVWADGIDPDGCRDVIISNCRIDTGDDAIVFYSHDSLGPALPCENITVTNCVLSSSSSALKFCDCNSTSIRNVVVTNCVITDSNRGIAFMVFDGGLVENVVISDVTIDCRRHDWFWWGDGDPLHFRVIRRSEVDPRDEAAKRRPVGVVRGVKLRGIVASGEGTCTIHGHDESPLTDVTFDDVRLSLSVNPHAPYTKGKSALDVWNGNGLRFTRTEVRLAGTHCGPWERPAVFRDVTNLDMEGFSTGSTAGTVWGEVELHDVLPSTGASEVCEGGSHE